MGSISQNTPTHGWGQFAGIGGQFKSECGVSLQRNSQRKPTIRNKLDKKYKWLLLCNEGYKFLKRVKQAYHLAQEFSHRGIDNIK